MMLLVEDSQKKSRKSLMLTEYPQSLIDAWKAGVLDEKLAEEAQALEPYHRRPHPWRQYPSAMTRRTDTSFRL